MRFEATVEGRTAVLEVERASPGYRVRLGDRALAVEVRETRPGLVSLLLDGMSVEAGLEKRPGGYTVHLPDRTLQVELSTATSGGAPAPRAATGPVRVSAPMPGRIVRVLVEPGQQVALGQALLVMEAMKMENELRAPRAGRVAQVPARPLTAVETGALLVVLE